MLDDTTKHSKLLREMVVKKLGRNFAKLESLLEVAVNLARGEHIDEANRIIDALKNLPRAPPARQDAPERVEGHGFVTEQSYQTIQHWLGGVSSHEREGGERGSNAIGAGRPSYVIARPDTTSLPFAVYCHRIEPVPFGTMDHDGNVVVSTSSQGTPGPNQGEEGGLLLPWPRELGPVPWRVQIPISESEWLQLQTNTIAEYPADNAQEARPMVKIEDWKHVISRNAAFAPKRSLFTYSIGGYLKRIQHIRRTHREVRVPVRQAKSEHTIGSSTTPSHESDTDAGTANGHPLAMESIWVDPNSAIIKTEAVTLAHTEFPVPKKALVRFSSEVATIRHAVYTVVANEKAINRRHYARGMQLHGGQDPTQRLRSGGKGSGLRNCISADEPWPEGEWGMAYQDPPRQRMELGIKWNRYEPAVGSGTRPQGEIR